MLGKNKMLSNIFDKGVGADFVRGAGVGVFVNIFDKKVAKGAITKAGISLGKSLNGQPVTLNGTDIITALATTGLNFGGKNLMTMIAVIGSKKILESYNYIDPPMEGIPDGETNVSMRVKKEQAEALAQKQFNQQVALMSQYGARSNF